jgi:hypothetical protein
MEDHHEECAEPKKRTYEFDTLAGAMRFSHTAGPSGVVAEDGIWVRHVHE